MSNDALKVYRDIEEYCDTYNIPLESLLEILEDQKVVPMIRGKATEFICALVLKRKLNPKDWLVEKLNLNAQFGTYDEDVSITHRRKGIRFKVEAKNAVRGKFSLGTRAYPFPHFAVKCHRSRSNFSRKENDRYMATDFDLLLCNVSNSLFRSTFSRGLPLIDKPEAIDWLRGHYSVETEAEIRRAAYDDWRICLPKDIVQEDGTIPRTPRVKMKEDPNWFGLAELEKNLNRLL